MNVAHIKEQISFHYVGNLAAASGYKVNTGYPDYGVDMIISKISPFRRVTDQKIIFRETGELYEIQLKCTDEGTSMTKEVGDCLTYKLKHRVFQDMERRFEEEQFGAVLVPLYLVVLVLARNKKDWVVVNADSNAPDRGQRINGIAYYYGPDDLTNQETFKKTKDYVLVEIPKTNQLDVDFLTKMF